MHFLWPVKGQRKVKKVRAFKELLTNSAPDLILAVASMVLHMMETRISFCKLQ